MNNVADYIAAALLTVIAIAVFLNVRNGTFGSWLKAKFLGLSAGTPAPTTPFTPASTS